MTYDKRTCYNEQTRKLCKNNTVKHVSWNDNERVSGGYSSRETRSWLWWSLKGRRGRGARKTHTGYVGSNGAGKSGRDSGWRGDCCTAEAHNEDYNGCRNFLRVDADIFGKPVCSRFWLLTPDILGKKVHRSCSGWMLTAGSLSFPSSSS